MAGEPGSYQGHICAVVVRVYVLCEFAFGKWIY